MSFLGWFKKSKKNKSDHDNITCGPNDDLISTNAEMETLVVETTRSFPDQTDDSNEKELNNINNNDDSDDWSDSSWSDGSDEEYYVIPKPIFFIPEAPPRPNPRFLFQPTLVYPPTPPPRPTPYLFPDLIRQNNAAEEIRSITHGIDKPYFFSSDESSEEVYVRPRNPSVTSPEEFFSSGKPLTPVSESSEEYIVSRKRRRVNTPDSSNSVQCDPVEEGRELLRMMNGIHNEELDDRFHKLVRDNIDRNDDFIKMIDDEMERVCICNNNTIPQKEKEETPDFGKCDKDSYDDFDFDSIDELIKAIENESFYDNPLYRRNHEDPTSDTDIDTDNDSESYDVEDSSECNTEELPYLEDISTDVSDNDSNDVSDISDSVAEGRLELYIGPMYSGKSSTILLKAAEMADIGYSVLYINHLSDNRVTESKDNIVSTHNSQYKTISPKIDAIKVAHLSNVNVKDYDYVAIDEGQFFDDLYENVLYWVTEYGKNVWVASLDGDAYRRKFGEVLDLVPHADKVKKLTAFCDVCRVERKIIKPAPFTGRLGDSRDPKIVGGRNLYIAMCRECHNAHLSKLVY
jgi:thymidine kinase